MSLVLHTKDIAAAERSKFQEDNYDDYFYNQLLLQQNFFLKPNVSKEFSLYDQK